MGYDRLSFTVHVRLERHNSEGDKRDDEAYERLQREIEYLIEADPDHRRIVAGGAGA